MKVSKIRYFLLWCVRLQPFSKRYSISRISDLGKYSSLEPLESSIVVGSRALVEHRTSTIMSIKNIYTTRTYVGYALGVEVVDNAMMRMCSQVLPSSTYKTGHDQIYIEPQMSQNDSKSSFV